MQFSRWFVLGVLAVTPGLTASPARAEDHPLRLALEFDPAPLDPATDGSYQSARRKNSTPGRGTALTQHSGLPPRPGVKAPRRKG